MNAVVNGGGTAGRARMQIEGIKMAGKSGTAQVRRISMAERRRGVIRNEALPWRLRDHALFIAYAPVDAPRFAAAVVIEHGIGGSAVAAPIARDCLTTSEAHTSELQSLMRIPSAVLCFKNKNTDNTKTQTLYSRHQ